MKRTSKMLDVAIQADHGVKLKENEKKDKYLDLASCNWCSWYRHRRIIKGTGEHGNKRTSGDHLNYFIIEIDPNTEKSSRDFRRLKRKC